jgi:WhiB family transcriptional regulator, redox-sensing transcriptional regulator
VNSCFEKAACLGKSPKIFDAFTFPEAAEAMKICSICTVVTECFNLVRPNKSFFDGVAGGIVWRNGYRVRENNTTREDRILRIRNEQNIGKA